MEKITKQEVTRAKLWLAAGIIAIVVRLGLTLWLIYAVHPLVGVVLLVTTEIINRVDKYFRGDWKVRR